MLLELRLEARSVLEARLILLLVILVVIPSPGVISPMSWPLLIGLVAVKSSRRVLLVLLLVIGPHSTLVLIISLSLLLLLLLLELHLSLVLLTLLLSFPLRLLLSLLLVVFLLSLLSNSPVTGLESEIIELWLRNSLCLFRGTSRLKLLEQ